MFEIFNIDVILGPPSPQDPSTLFDFVRLCSLSNRVDVTEEMVNRSLMKIFLCDLFQLSILFSRRAKFETIEKSQWNLWRDLIWGVKYDVQKQLRFDA